MTAKNLKELIRQIVKELSEEDLDEITGTGDVAGYNTPNAFSNNKKKRRKQIKKANNSIGYVSVNEELDNNDLKSIRELIRNTVADILRDIWLKRNTWK